MRHCVPQQQAEEPAHADPAPATMDLEELKCGPHGELVKLISEEVKKREEAGWKVGTLLGGKDDDKLPLSCAAWAYEWVPHGEGRPLTVTSKSRLHCLTCTSRRAAV